MAFFQIQTGQLLTTEQGKQFGNDRAVPTEHVQT